VTTEHRARWIERSGKQIYVIDYVNLHTRDDVIALIWRSARTIQAEPKGSVRVLMLAGDTYIDQTVAGALREAGLQNTPYLKGVAVVGLTGVLKIIHRTMALLMRQTIPTFDSESDALDWLASQ
jgi:hypothetical protein